MTYQDLAGKKIAILGLGIENYALIKFLFDKKVACDVTICDRQDRVALTDKYQALKGQPQIKWQLGKNYDAHLSHFDLVVRAPGYPLFSKALKKLGNQTILTSPINLFYTWCPSNKIIGVTGTKGKGTTASLIHYIFKTAKLRSHLGGNIGVAPFGFLDKIKPRDWVVLELSSFQLQDSMFSPHIAVITNFFSEHLKPVDPHNPNYHHRLRDYWEAKVRLCRWQNKGDYLVVNKNLRPQISKLPLASKIIYFSHADFLSRLPGQHNKENVAAAAAVCKLAKVPLPLLERGIARFPGLEHRLELVAKIKGAAYYNDSFATIPESCIVAIKAFAKPLLLIAGGADKGSDFRLLGKIIAKHQVKYLLLLKGKATPRLKAAALQAGYPSARLKEFGNLKTAVTTATNLAKPGNVILLSPACASFGMFANYKQRGAEFKSLVKNKTRRG